MYTEKVMDHFAHPRNMGEIKDANGVGMVVNALALDKFRCHAAGCNSRTAAESLEANVLNNAVIVDFQEHLHDIAAFRIADHADAVCILDFAHIAEEAVKAAVDNYYARKEGRTDSECNCVSCGHDHEHDHDHEHEENAED